MTDRDYMEQALALGANGEVATSPNPRVGCVVVRGDRVVGRGFHQAPGLLHAEALALRDAGDSARGATLYVSLEPCAHHGRTPPCAEAIVDSGIVRVVAALQDPNPIVDGRGFDRLRAAGVAVEIGLLGEDSRRMNDAFVHFHRTGRPLVTLEGRHIARRNALGGGWLFALDLGCGLRAASRTAFECDTTRCWSARGRPGGTIHG